MYAQRRKHKMASHGYSCVTYDAHLHANDERAAVALERVVL
jgi:hypothetical protein